MKRPNIILISIDTLRADHLSCYGYHRNTTPNLDRIASAGIRFTDASSAAVWTPPAHASMLTGLYPSQHGVMHQNKLRGEVSTIAELLNQNGYQTAGFVNNSQVGELVGLDRGHNDFSEVWRGWSQKQVFRRISQKILGLTGFADHGAAQTNRLVEDWLKNSREDKDPFYLFIHYIDAHNPLQAPRPFLYKYLSKALQSRVDMSKIWKVANNPLICISDQMELSSDEIEALACLYDEEIAYVDYRIGQLIATLEEMNLLDDTLLLVTADHGEHLGENGLYSHVASLYQPILHIPLILHYPARVTSGVTDNRLVQHIDLLPTICEAAHVSTDNSNLPGVNLLDKEDQAPDRIIFAEWEGRVPYFVQDRLSGQDDSDILDGLRKRMWMCRSKQHKLIARSDANIEMYDLESDPEETVNIADANSGTLIKLQKHLKEWQASLDSDLKPEQYDYSENQIKQHLKALGYL